MWVEVEHENVPTAFNKHDKIRVVVERGHTWEGLFIKADNQGTDTYIHMDQPGYCDYPVCLYVWRGRKFYKWVEDKPVDESKLRLNKPDPLLEADVAVAADILERRVEKTTRCDVQVGRHTYVLEPGDHLRVWWEDGALWSELVQERTK